MELGKGEALVSFLEGNGTPSMVERCMIRPPSGRVGPITADERKALVAASPVKGKYDEMVESRNPRTKCCRSVSIPAQWCGREMCPVHPARPRRLPPGAVSGA